MNKHIVKHIGKSVVWVFKHTVKHTGLQGKNIVSPYR
jgi:hypothetical protein